MHLKSTAGLLLPAFVFTAGLSAQEVRNVLACERSGGALPSVGAYCFFVDADNLFCVAPSNDADGTDVPCLRIGEVHVGQTRGSIEMRLGSPYQNLDPRLPGFTTSAYLVFQDSLADKTAYYVVEYEQLHNREIAFSVQLTGTRPDTLHHFSCLHLEDDETAVRRQLGEPTDISPFQFEEDGVSGVVWCGPMRRYRCRLSLWTGRCIRFGCGARIMSRRRNGS